MNTNHPADPNTIKPWWPWLLLLLALLLACGTSSGLGTQGNTMASQLPSWACPTDTPMPYEDAGPLRDPGCCCDESCDTDPVTGEEDCTCISQDGCYECRYYIWEQEDGGRAPPLGGPPFPGPTEYTREREHYHHMGQIINMPNDVDIVVTVDSTGNMQVDESTGDEFQLHVVNIEWDSKFEMDFTINPGRQISIQAIETPGSTRIQGPWRFTEESYTLAQDLGIDVGVLREEGAAPTPTPLPDGVDPPEATPEARDLVLTSIVSGTQTTRVPILAPEGDVAVVDLRLDPLSANHRGMNTAEDHRISLIQESDPHCDHPGISHWNPGPGERGAFDRPLPPGGDAVVDAALSQVGRQYCFGGKGYTPCSGLGRTSPCGPGTGQPLPCFDCSGLTWWAYQEAANTEIGGHTSLQLQHPSVSVAEVLPGDLLNFPGHVGMYAGDVDGDGTGDMVHAGWEDLGGPGIGIVIEPDVLAPGSYYRNQLLSITRPPRRSQ